MSKHRNRIERIVLGLSLSLAAGLGLASMPAHAERFKGTATINGKQYNVLTPQGARELNAARELNSFKRLPGPFIPPRPPFSGGSR